MGNHHPPHFLLDDSWYFITAATYQKGLFLQVDGHKSIVQESLKQLSASFSLKLAAWVIMDNHYHLLLHAQTPEALKGFVQRLHGRTAYEINKNSNLKGRQIWHNYWDTIIRSDTDFWTRFNYVHYNPVKHRYVRDPNDWKFSSYPQYLNINGKEWMDKVLETYPIVDILLANDDH